MAPPFASKRDRRIGEIPKPALARLVRAARGPVSQQSFAERLGVAQETLSRYENGQVSPRSEVVAKCWEAFEERAHGSPPAADELAKRMQFVGGEQFTAVREAIARLIELATSKGQPGRPKE